MSLRHITIPVLIALAAVVACGSAEMSATRTSTTKSSTGSFAGAESNSQGWVGGHSCEEQASWGKCSESWMHPVCSYACGGDSKDSQSGWVGGHSCEEQASWGKCSESWMHPVCSSACGLSAGQVYYWSPNAPQAEQQPQQPAIPQNSQNPQPPRYGTSTLPYPFNNNGLMIPNLGPHELWSNNTGLLYPNVGGANAFPYSNSTSTGVMGDGTGLVTTNWSGGYSFSPYWNGMRTPYK